MNNSGYSDKLSNDGRTLVSLLLSDLLLLLWAVLLIYDFTFKMGSGSKAIHRQKWEHKKCPPNGRRPTADLKYKCDAKTESGRSGRWTG